MLTKRVLTSDIARTYDVLGWFAPCAIGKDPSPTLVGSERSLGRPGSRGHPKAVGKVEKRAAFPTDAFRDATFPDARVQSMQLHGFSDASEVAYSAAVYLRSVAECGVSLVMSKTKIAPIRRLTIPHLELCGASLLAILLSHTKHLFATPTHGVYAWTDSTVVWVGSREILADTKCSLEIGSPR